MNWGNVVRKSFWGKFCRYHRKAAEMGQKRPMNWGYVRIVETLGVLGDCGRYEGTRTDLASWRVLGGMGCNAGDCSAGDYVTRAGDGRRVVVARGICGKPPGVYG